MTGEDVGESWLVMLEAASERPLWSSMARTGIAQLHQILYEKQTVSKEYTSRYICSPLREQRQPHKFSRANLSAVVLFYVEYITMPLVISKQLWIRFGQAIFAAYINLAHGPHLVQSSPRVLIQEHNIYSDFWHWKAWEANKLFKWILTGIVQPKLNVLFTIISSIAKYRPQYKK